jgi:hypothetical protein
MAVYTNDSDSPLHGKPVVDFELKSVDGGYQDYSSIDDVKSSVNINFRKNKHFRIDGDVYFVDQDDNFKLVGGKSTEFQFTDDFFDDQNLTS